MNTILYIPTDKSLKWTSTFYHFVVDFLGNLYRFEKKELKKEYSLMLDLQLAEGSILQEKPMEEIQGFARPWVDIILPNVSNVIYKDFRDFFNINKRDRNSYYHKPTATELDHALKSDKNNYINIGQIKGHIIHKSSILFLKEKVDLHLKNYEIKQNKILLIKRTKTRITNNFDDIRKLCLKVCDELNLELDIFDDSNVFGTVTEQLLRFRNAKIIIGQHGAGFVNLIACRENTHFIEFTQETQRLECLHPGDPDVYEQIAKILNISYKSFKNDGNNCVDTNEILAYLEILIDRIKGKYN